MNLHVPPLIRTSLNRITRLYYGRSKSTSSSGLSQEAYLYSLRRATEARVKCGWLLYAREDRPSISGKAAKRVRKEVTESRKDSARKAKQKIPFDPAWEDAFQQAIYFKNRHPEASFRFLAQRFQPTHTSRKLYHSLLERRWNGKSKSQQSLGGYDSQRLLSDAEEEAMMEILDRYQYIGTPLRLPLLRGVANRMLRNKTLKDTLVDEIPTVGRDWPRNFVKRNENEWKTLKLKFLDVQRKAAHKRENIARWFELFELICDEFDLAPAQIWNMDETGFRIGVLEGGQLVVCRREVKALYPLSCISVQVKMALVRRCSGTLI